MKSLFASILLFFASAAAYGQLDSVDFNAHFESNPQFTAGLDSLSAFGDVLQVEVFLNEPAMVGAATVLVYDAATETPLAIVRRTRTEILSGQFTQNGFVVFNIPYLDVQGQFKVVLEVQNFQMAYLNPISKFFPNNQ